jgi:hypothetical protein
MRYAVKEYPCNEHDRRREHPTPLLNQLPFSKRGLPYRRCQIGQFWGPFKVRDPRFVITISRAKDLKAMPEKYMISKRQIQIIVRDCSHSKSQIPSRYSRSLWINCMKFMDLASEYAQIFGDLGKKMFITFHRTSRTQYAHPYVLSLVSITAQDNHSPSVEAFNALLCKCDAVICPPVAVVPPMVLHRHSG